MKYVVHSMPAPSPPYLVHLKQLDEVVEILVVQELHHLTVISHQLCDHFCCSQTNLPLFIYVETVCTVIVLTW